MWLLRILLWPAILIGFPFELLDRWLDERALRRYEREWREWEAAYRRELWLLESAGACDIDPESTYVWPVGEGVVNERT